MLDFANEDNEKNKYSNINFSYFKKVIKPSDEELKKHKEYLKKNLKNNYF